jgi:competence protein ComGC
MLQLEKLFAQKRCQSEWGSLYMLIVLIIAALLLIAVVKPMFKQSQQVIKETKAAAQ